MLQAKQQNGKSPAAGPCTVQASVTFPRYPTLTQTNSTSVVTIASLNLYALTGDAPSAPPANTSLAPSKLSALSPLRLLKCDWRNYQTRCVSEPWGEQNGKAYAILPIEA